MFSHNASPENRRLNLGIKIVVSMVLFFMLTVFPSGYMWLLVADREATRDTAVEDISDKWAAPQTITGPIMTVPYTETVKGVDETKYVTFLPKTLNITGSMETEERSRGIYHVPVYTSTLTLTGSFDAADFTTLGIDAKKMVWKDASLDIGLSDLKGLQDLSLEWDGASKKVNAGVTGTEALEKGVSTDINLEEKNQTAHTFTISATLRGSEELFFTPVGETTTVALTSNWQNPSFDGTFLPENYTLSADGFTANWKVLYLNRNYPQMWKNNDYSFSNATFGTNLFTPNDSYQKITRSVKYMALFVFLTFFIFFFAEILNRQRIHPIQYSLVGMALVLFYFLLLSLSEHVGFGISYAVATVGVVGLITSYVKSSMNNNKFAGIMGAILLALYGALYVILQLTDFALLIGTVLCFSILAVIMYLTRKVDWYEL